MLLMPDHKAHPEQVARALWWAVTLSWATSAAVLPLIFVTAGAGERDAFIALDAWLCAVAVVTTVTAAIRTIASDHAAYFDRGYLAGMIDSREPRVVSIASLRRPEIPRQEDRRDSNKVS